MAKRRKKRVAQRGSVNNIILKTLLSGDKYGYEIIKEVEEFSDGKICLKQPSLYSSLGRFEEKKIVSSYWGDSDIGGRRHYYHLTESGREYYQKEILKIKTDDGNGFSNTNEDDVENDDDITMTEMEENEIPAIVDFPSEEPKSEPVPDHHFYKSTPMEQNMDEFEEQYVLKKEPYVHSSAPVTLGTQTTNTCDKPWKDFADNTKLSNSKVVGTAFEKLRFSKNTSEPNEETLKEEPQIQIESTTTPTFNNSVEPPINQAKAEPQSPIKTMENSSIETKKSKIILDKDGIYKLRDNDYDPSIVERKNKPEIIDNVIKRTNSSTIYGYSAYTEPQKQPPSQKSTIELSDEERKIKNNNFMEKFDSISSFKKQEKADDELNNTYLQKLDFLKKSYEETQRPIESHIYSAPKAPIITKSIFDKEDEETTPYEEPQNNLFNYEDEDEEDAFVDIGGDEEEESQVEDDDSYVDMEPEKFEVKNENKQYIEKFSNYSAPKESIKINRYENKPTAILSDKTYVLINKVKFVFGLILAVVMFGQLALTHYILGKHGLIVDGDKTIFIVSYCLTGVLTILNILPVIFNSNEHKLNTYKTKYACLFGVLTFLISIILIYCTNALFGFKLSNFEYFATKLIVPAVLTLNFVILPPIYGLLLKSKKFYD